MIAASARTTTAGSAPKTSASSPVAREQPLDLPASVVLTRRLPNGVNGVVRSQHGLGSLLARRDLRVGRREHIEERAVPA